MGTFINASLEIPGRNTGGWVTAGPWANAMVLMGPGNSLSYTPHCLRRNFSPTLANLRLNSSVLAWVQKARDLALHD
ncbi:hypothetical protein WAI453_010953 [Rhynchosporium graminicola]